ncbi:MAG: thioredoxin domain-containing protein [Chitinophagales bacterium]|nr:thioredoxin domain-containing protein [Chitinophagales bacterium]
MATLKDTSHPFTNHLIHETSPYLLQHSHNPVDWYPWGEEALKKAKDENKLLLISIGYSSCHWCHVMEHESFEDTATARLMNENFICIKVDREERPDIDQVYMNAVQLISGSGGWPLNCFALPDGRPIYGGTYFPTASWKEILTKLSALYKNDPEKTTGYASLLINGIKESDLVQLDTSKPDFTADSLKRCVSEWSNSFDTNEGGPNHAPKFPLPNNYLFLLKYAYLQNDKKVMKQVNLTLHKMALGGIYDQIGGGFARYSTDTDWKVPHFEKMLYDNAQLVSLYCAAYQLTKDPLYKQVVYETLEWIQREMTSSEGCFYSALDADAEGEEGKYYVWKKEELQNLLGDDFSPFADYYNVNEIGYWEHGNYILVRKDSDEGIAKRWNLSNHDFESKIVAWKKKLLQQREMRIKPGLDDKSLTSWNAMMIQAYTDAYVVFKEENFLNAALTNAQFILTKQLKQDGSLFHSYKNNRSSVNGFLEDYSFSIAAFIALYEATFDEKWLQYSRNLAEYTMMHFSDTSQPNGMYYFTSDLDPALIARKTETSDNVIPASNSVMAHNLFLLGKFFDREHYMEHSGQMLNTMKPFIIKYGSGYSNWALLMLEYISASYEIAITGPDAVRKRREFGDYFIPNSIFFGCIKTSDLPLLRDKFIEGKTFIYICENKTCQLPVTEIHEALKQIK